MVRDHIKEFVKVVPSKDGKSKTYFTYRNVESLRTKYFKLHEDVKMRLVSKGFKWVFITAAKLVALACVKGGILYVGCSTMFKRHFR